MFLEEIKEINLNDIFSKEASEKELFEKRLKELLKEGPEEIEKLYNEVIYIRQFKSLSLNKSPSYIYEQRTIEVIEYIYLNYEGYIKPLDKKGKGNLKDYDNLKILGPIFRHYETKRKIDKSLF